MLYLRNANRTYVLCTMTARVPLGRGWHNRAEHVQAGSFPASAPASKPKLHCRLTCGGTISASTPIPVTVKADAARGSRHGDENRHCGTCQRTSTAECRGTTSSNVTPPGAFL